MHRAFALERRGIVQPDLLIKARGREVRAIAREIDGINRVGVKHIGDVFELRHAALQGIMIG
jgi:hypothetical protein